MINEMMLTVKRLSRQVIQNTRALKKMKRGSRK